jgi:murein L,D-transpeptidase YcbB/YkuD
LNLLTELGSAAAAALATAVLTLLAMTIFFKEKKPLLANILGLLVGLGVWASSQFHKEFTGEGFDDIARHYLVEGACHWFGVCKPTNKNPQTTTAPTTTPLVAEPSAPVPQNFDGPHSPPSRDQASSPGGRESSEGPKQAPVSSSQAVDLDEAITNNLRELPNGRFDHILKSKQQQAKIASFYASRAYAPVWISAGKLNARAEAAIKYLANVGADGLDPDDYLVPNSSALTNPADLAEVELKLDLAIIAYAHHASVGRVHWSRVSADIYYTGKAPEPADVLSGMAEAKDVAGTLTAYEPRAAGYLALKAKLAEIRAGKAEAGKTPIGNGAAPKIGGQDERVPLLRERLNVSGDGDTYDKALADEVKKYQLNHQLKVTGTLTPQTIDALNGRQPDKPVDVILANLERWRWMPHDLGNTYVIANLADFTLRVIHDDKLAWNTRIVDGAASSPTPLISAEMRYITVNPTFSIPQHLVTTAWLPALQQDPTIAERMGVKVVKDSQGTIHIYQPPGDQNQLGRLRFSFPNKFSVEQHDTPDKYLFAYDKRAFAKCDMRVQDPQKYAEVLLSAVRPGDGYTLERIKKMIDAGGETDIQFPTFIPVHLTYQTAFVDDNGKLQFRDDVYGLDKKLLAIVKSDLKNAESPVQPQPELLGGQDCGEDTGFTPGDFFSRLFGASANRPPETPHPPKNTRRDGDEFFRRLFGGPAAFPSN